MDGGDRVSVLGYADDFVLLATTAEGLQQLIDAAADYCVAIGMAISVPKTKTMVFTDGEAQHASWHCNGQVLQQLDNFKYLGLLFNAQSGVQGTFPLLKQKMFAAWALLKRQYGNLSCTSSVGLMLRVYDVCVPATASYGCEIWACQRFSAAASTERARLPKLHLQILKQILGVRKTVPTELIWREVPLKRLEDVWWQRTIKFWNSLAAAPAASLYRRIALASCRSALTRNVHNWAWSFYRAVRACKYMLDIRVDDLDPIAEATFKSYRSDVHDAAWQALLATWQGLSVNPRTCPRDNMPRLCTYNAWFARPAVTHRKVIFRLPLSNKCVQSLLRFRLGCHNLPRDVGTRTAIPRSQRFCHVCSVGQPGDEYHLVFECRGLQHIRDRYPGLFGHHAETMIQFMWQADLHGPKLGNPGVAKFVTDCLGAYYDTDPDRGRASDQP